MTRAFISIMIVAVWALPVSAQQTPVAGQNDYARVNAEYQAVKRDCADMRAELDTFIGPVNDPLAPRDEACAGLRVAGAPPAQNWGWRSCSDEFFARYEAKRALYRQCFAEEERLGRERLALYRQQVNGPVQPVSAPRAVPPSQPSAQPGWLGVEIDRLTPDRVRRLGLGTPAGVYVRGTVPGSPAQQAGLRQGDVIVGFDGQRVANTDDIQAYARGILAGQTIPIDIVRNQQTQTIQVAIQARP